MIEIIITAIVTVGISTIIVMLLSCIRIASIADQRLEKAHDTYILEMEDCVDGSQEKNKSAC